jgi:hypothetical protein
MRLRFAAAALAAFAGLGFPVDSALACSVCQAGDPVLSSNGAAPMEAGRGSVYLELQGWRKTSGLLPEGGPQIVVDENGNASVEEPEAEEGREVNQSQMLSLYLSASPIDRMTLTLNVPWRFNVIHEEPAGEEPTTSSLSGVGDLSLTAGYVLWRDRDVLPSTWIEARVFGKAPTGQRVQEVDGKEDPHLQLGTGSWDWGVGIAAGQRAPWFTLYASVFQRFNGPGSLQYEYGDVTLANLAIEAPLGHVVGRSELDLLTPGLELNYRYAAADRSFGRRYVDSGGGVLYLTPSLRLRLPGLGSHAPSLRVSAQFPLVQKYLHNEQHEGVVWTAGIGVPF